jgi:hypothetical protein
MLRDVARKERRRRAAKAVDVTHPPSRSSSQITAWLIRRLIAERAFQRDPITRGAGHDCERISSESVGDIRFAALWPTPPTGAP